MIIPAKSNFGLLVQRLENNWLLTSRSGFDSLATHHFRGYGETVSQQAFNLLVEGSSPSGPTNCAVHENGHAPL